ncbi:MAG: ATP-dependent Clp protease ATP-binding subunit [Lachnospiraceae bacterium]|nr:ATP-dependent Clp protease ATP-binding subunit [Lachnospiraceae bacterium]
MEYTTKALEVMRLAKEAAKEMKQNYLGTEHILIGLLREGTGVAALVLRENNVQESQILELIDQLIAPGTDVVLKEHDGLTPRAQKILELAEETAERFECDKIGTEHILLSLIREGDSAGIRLMNTLGINLMKVYSDTLQAIGEDPNLAREDLKVSRQTSSREEGAGNSSTPMLDKYSRDLTEMAREGRLDPVIGREEEIMRVVQILSRRTKNNPCLVGEPGVGKTAIAEGLAVKIVEGNVPPTIIGKRVVSLDISGMVAGSKYRGEFEERIKRTIAEVESDGNILLFMDEIHTLIGAGGAEGAIDASNILKPSLARGELQLIGATTLEEYRKYIEKDAALERRFQPVTVEEPDEEEAIRILLGIKDKYEEHHGIIISDEAVEAAVKLSARYINDRFLPDKAIDVMDEASSHLRITNMNVDPKLAEMKAEIDELENDKEKAIVDGDIEEAKRVREEQQKLKKKLERAESRKKKKDEENKLVLDANAIADVVARWTKIPVGKLTEKENDRLMNLEKILHKRVIGQEEAVTTISKAIRRGRVGLKDPKRPVGSFLFLGPTGVGKTELSKALAEAMFGSENSLIRVDMSEYMEPHSVAKMIGAPPGYVGHDEGGQLAEKIRRNPYSVILFDEIEKAHPDVFNVLLQVLDDGHITDSKGRKVSFKNAIIIMTSNAGAQAIVEPKHLGFGAGSNAEAEYKNMKGNVMAEVKRLFKPEFINRIDDIIVFHQLTKDNMKDIVTLLAKGLQKRALDQMNINLRISGKVKEHIIEKGSDQKYGARPLRRAIQNMIEDPLAEELLSGHCKAGDQVHVNISNGKIVFKTS